MATEYLKHIYSGRIYQIIRDHGPDHPYLWSPWEFAIRNPGQRRWDEFFRPCEKPEVMPTGYSIRIPDEIAWEDRKLRGTQPIVVKAPTVKPRPRPRSKVKDSEVKQSNSGEYTVQDLALELGCTPGQARAALRKSKLEKPQGGWRWSSPEDADPARKAIKENLK